MNKIYYLASCDTCRKIIRSLPDTAQTNTLVFQDIRQEPVTPAQLEEMKNLAGNYESLFSRKAQLYKSQGLKDQHLTEDDFKKYILAHYTFLSRPVFIIAGSIYIGNSPKTIAQVIAALQ